MNLAFFGSPAPAARVLDRLVESGRVPVVVVSQPDRPVGRGRRLTPCPVAARARDLGLALEQPSSVRGDDFRNELQGKGVDLALVVAYGRILPAPLLEVPHHGFLNVHFSLLPRHRGASPVAASILAGDPETGVSIMRLDEGLDTGPVIDRRRVALDGTERCGELTMSLAEVGADLLLEVIARLEAGESLPGIPQPEKGSSLCRPTRREEARIDWSLSAEELDRRLRAFDPWPGAFTFLDDLRVRILQARVVPVSSLPGSPGEVVAEADDGLLVATGRGSWALERVQPAGGRVMTARELARGRRLKTGSRFS